MQKVLCQFLNVSNSYKWFLTIFTCLCFNYFSFSVKNFYVICNSFVLYKHHFSKQHRQKVPKKLQNFHLHLQTHFFFTNQLLKREFKKSCLPLVFSKIHCFANKEIEISSVYNTDKGLNISVKWAYAVVFFFTKYMLQRYQQTKQLTVNKKLKKF